jgi:5'/3'-nucleotidase
MNILLTNDDGFDADGINALFEVFSKKHDVYMIAPDKERSACSNAFTVREELKIIKKDEKKYTLSGFPADCVSIGLHSKIIPEIDIVISGINHGPNVGEDIFFSGTVGAARTAYIFGKTGIAVSVDSFHRSSEFFHDTASFLLNYINEREEELIREKSFINVNYPDIPKKKIKGVKYTFTGTRIYNDTYSDKEEEGEILLSLSKIITSEKIDGSDATELEKGYISITPLTIENTDFKSPMLRTI